MEQYHSNSHTRIIVVVLLVSLLVEARDLLNPSAMPAYALAWTAFAVLAYLSLAVLIARGHPYFVAAGILAALNIAATSLNPVDPYFLTHWDTPWESFLVVLEGYALPILLLFFVYHAYREKKLWARS